MLLRELSTLLFVRAEKPLEKMEGLLLAGRGLGGQRINVFEMFEKLTQNSSGEFWGWVDERGHLEAGMQG
jgi:hypothetical protein